jgi:hypothetical protein
MKGSSHPAEGLTDSPGVFLSQGKEYSASETEHINVLCDLPVTEWSENYPEQVANSSGPLDYELFASNTAKFRKDPTY